MRPPLSAAPLPHARRRCRSCRYALTVGITLRQASTRESERRWSHNSEGCREKKPQEGVDKRERRVRSEALEGGGVREEPERGQCVKSQRERWCEDGKLRGVRR